MENNEMYRKRKCELCGNFAFEKHLGTSQVLDGGFTRIENFEKSGFGALVVNYWDITNVKETRLELMLCPECASKIDNAMHDVIKDLKNQGAK